MGPFRVYEALYNLRYRVHTAQSSSESANPVVIRLIKIIEVLVYPMLTDPLKNIVWLSSRDSLSMEVKKTIGRP